MDAQVTLMTPQLAKPRAIIYDWDDTIVDNWVLAVEALNRTLEHMGKARWSDEEARRRAGPSARDLFIDVFGADKWEQADKFYYNAFYELVSHNARIHDYAEEMLKSFQELGIFLAVVSNKRGELLRRDAARIGFDKYFGNIIGAGDAAADKPDPAPVLLALAGSGIAPGPDVWFIGDSYMDMRCALNSGCTPVLIETKPPPEDVLAQHPPAHRFRHHGELMELVQPYFAAA